MGIIFNGADSYYNKFDRYNLEAQYLTSELHKYELMKTVTDTRGYRLKENADQFVPVHSITAYKLFMTVVLVCLMTLYD